MALIRKLLGKSPVLGEDCFLSETCVIVGDVTMGDQCSVWFNAVIRGDVNFIKIGNKVNIQDNAMIHCTYQKYPTYIGNNVSIGHNAIVHGCTIHDNVLIGMGAIVMDNAIVESNAIIAAGAVVTQGKHVKSGELWAGVPAKKISDVSQELQEGEIRRIANNYVKYSSWYDEPEDDEDGI
jgi:carbonic anhydrase/acetyltransferase-like protein (isoleucine patch superfamily)